MTVLNGRRALAALTLAAIGATTLTAPALAAPAALAPAAPAGALSAAQLDVGRSVAKAARSKQVMKSGRASNGQFTTAEVEGEVYLSAAPHVVDFGQADDGIGVMLAVGNSSGELVWRFWYSDLGWQVWERVPGGIKGAPSVVVNPISGRIEFYVDSGNEAWQAWLTKDNEFGVEPFGGRTVTEAPTTLINQGNGNVQVYANDGGNLYERYQRASDGTWSQWNSLGLTGLKGPVTPYFNPFNGNVQLYGNVGDKLVEKWWNRRTGAWSGWNTFDGSITGTPVAFFNARNGNTSIFVERNGDLIEKYWQAGNGRWSAWGDFNGDITGRPAVFRSPVNGNVQIYANSRGKVNETYWRASDGTWFGWSGIGTGAAVQSDPFPIYNSTTREVQVYAVDVRGQLALTSWKPGKPWSAWDTKW